ncbi:MAG TPA: CheR family methyltransferase [Bryobacteraceae bacterium]|nr:CheR family methyltransferase [Bryobacteraceae bacterium]
MPLETTENGIGADHYKFLQTFVYSQSGIVIGDDKHYLLQTRLAPITRQLGLGSIGELCGVLATGRETAVRRQVVEAMTTNETYFFRDPSHYDALKTSLLPELREQRKLTRKLSFWSAAASTGQEIYSLAMQLSELGLGDWNLQLLGTDFSTQVLERARAAKYLQIEVNRGLPTPMLVKYFQRQGLEWQLKDTIRRLVRFEQIDLRAPMRALGPFDAVFCRNVLIYFDAATRRKILEEMHGTLFRGGWLLLGTAELPTGLERLFERKMVGAATVYVAR